MVALDVDLAAAEDAAHQVELAGGSALAVQADVADPDAMQAAVDAALRRYGRIDILQANAGIGKVGGPLVQRKADREARTLLKVFAKVIRLIEENPADVYARLKERPDVPKPELEEFRKLLGVP